MSTGNPYDSDSEFWQRYLQGRPKVPSSFFQRVYDYHTLHGGHFDVVNDIGAGVGQLSSVLAKRFQRVIVTDPGETNIETAKSRLLSSPQYSSNDASSPFTFVQAKCEDDIQPPASVDMVFTTSAMHFVDLGPGMDAIAKQLKPGGTFCCAFFGVIVLEDPKLQEIWSRLYDAGIISLKNSGFLPPDRFKAVIEIQDSGFDAVPLSPEYFETRALRIKKNTYGDGEAFRMSKSLRDDIPLVSRITPGERQESEEDLEWHFEKTLDGLKAHIGTIPFPDHTIFDPFWKELDSALDNGVCRGHWPVSIILATRKGT
ncbi:hypothetical protein MMC08_008912 [Hypocenomyce scalaris]|nr:hypothetical protein [Hypocenomyce scalaris]